MNCIYPQPNRIIELEIKKPQFVKLGFIMKDWNFKVEIEIKDWNFKCEIENLEIAMKLKSLELKLQESLNWN